MELLASIVIIAVLAALATPSFIAMIRDRRVVRAGIQLADVYREARTRALSRGNAVIVRWQAGVGSKGLVEMRESVIAAAGAGTAAGCRTSATQWANGSATTREVKAFGFPGNTYELAQIKLFSEANAEAAFGEVCFAADGKTYVRYVDNAVFTQLKGVPHYEVINTQTTVKRLVYVPPNGVARLQL
jgi:Tfp pilus assembly protein FimT